MCLRGQVRSPAPGPVVKLGCRFSCTAAAGEGLRKVRAVVLETAVNRRQSREAAVGRSSPGWPESGRFVLSRPGLGRVLGAPGCAGLKPVYLKESAGSMHGGSLKRPCPSPLDMQKVFRAPCEADAGIPALLVSCRECYKPVSTAVTR